MPTAFGIDFGTTNTRVAYYDGATVRIVPFRTRSAGVVHQFRTRVGYRNGAAAAFGPDAAALGADEVFDGLKWLLQYDPPVPLPGGGTRDRVEVAADFLREVRRQAGEAVMEPMARAAVTIPVHYPPAARARLREAFAAADIEVTRFFYEPTAAIYAGLLSHRVAGVAAVFDWGGGSLDVATVQVRDGVALTRQVAGWHRGGSDFDRLVAGRALDDFLARHRAEFDAAGLPVPAADEFLALGPGRELVAQAEAAKVDLAARPTAPITRAGFLYNRNLSYTLTRPEFDALIEPEVRSGVRQLEQALRDSGVQYATLARLFLSGGTCNLAAVRNRLAAEVAGHLTVSKLDVPKPLRFPAAGPELSDIGNATAVGAALLAVHGAEPVFAGSVGVRLAGGDRFYPVFHAGRPAGFEGREEKFFVTDAGGQVARLLVCDQDEGAPVPGGRLLAVVPVPIRPGENWVVARFTLDRDLVLRVEADGRANFAVPPNPGNQRLRSSAVVQQLNLGFRLPEMAATPPPPRSAR